MKRFISRPFVVSRNRNNSLSSLSPEIVNLLDEILSEVKASAPEYELQGPPTKIAVMDMVITCLLSKTDAAMEEPLMTTRTENAVEDVIRKIRLHLQAPVFKRNTTQKTVARQIVDFLDHEYDLTSNVMIEDFASNKSTEASKSRSQVAIATQRAAAFFALQANLLQASLDELQQHIDVTKKSNSGTYGDDYYSNVFVLPLLKQAEDLKLKLELAEQQRHEAQTRFQKLRHLATRPIMEQLRVTSKSYSTLFMQMDPSNLCAEVQNLKSLIPRANDNLPLLQTLSLTQLPQQQQQQQQQRQITDRQTVEYLQALYRDAQRARGFLQTILLRVQKMCKEKSVSVEVEMGGLKSVERAMEKTVEEYGGDFSRLLDLARGSLVCQNIDSAAMVAKAIGDMAEKQIKDMSIAQLKKKITEAGLSHADCFERAELQERAMEADALIRGSAREKNYSRYEVVRVKNRLDRMFAAAVESGGYRDLLINLRMNDGHVCEVQVQIEGFLNVKTGGGHKTYIVARSLHLLDPELSQVRVVSTIASAQQQQSNEMESSASLQRALARVENGTCQALHLNHFKLSVIECIALRNALQATASNVREISLGGCGLDAERSAVFCDMASGNIGDLVAVDLFGNEGISGGCVASLVSGELQKLSIEDCKLNLAGFETFCQALVARKAWLLKDLNLGWNEIGPKGAQHLSRALVNMLSMSSLKLGYSKLGPQGAQHLVRAFLLMKNLSLLDLSRNGLGTPGASTLAQCLTDMKHMTTLILKGNDLGSQGAQELAVVFSGMKNMTSFDLSNNHIGPSGAKDLSGPLANMRKLTSLNLRGNQFGSKGAEHLASALSNSQKMTSLNLGYNQFGVMGAWHIAELLLDMHGLTFLDLHANKLGPHDSDHLARALTPMTHMTTLDLGSNDLGASGMEHLSGAFVNMTGLTFLDVWGNDLGPQGAHHLASSLINKSDIVSLNISHNRLGAEGMEALAEPLSKMHKLSTLNLASNKISPEGVQHLTTAIANKPNMLDLNLALNELGTEGVNSISVHLLQMSHITALNISNNTVDAETKIAIAKLFPSTLEVEI